MAKKNATVSAPTCISDAIGLAYGEIEDLASTMRDWYDNCSENLQQSDKMQTVDSTASDLEGESEPSLPDWLGWVRFYLHQHNRTGKQQMRLSRPARRDDAVWFLQQIVDFLVELEEMPQVEYEDGSGVKHTVKIDEEQKEEISGLRDELENTISNVEAVEFPGMYG